MKNFAKTLAMMVLSSTVFASSAAFADGHTKSETSGFYVSAFGGVLFNGDLNTSGTIGGAANSVNAETDTSFLIGAAIGTAVPELGNGAISPRFELEISYSNADVDQVQFSGNGPGNEINVEGDISTTLILANAYLDFATDSSFTPFIGGGLGIGIVDFDFAYGGAARPGLRQSDTGLAAQAVVGFSVDITDNVKWVSDARYSRVFDVDSDRALLNGTNTGTLSGDIDNFAITTGLRYSF